MEKEVIFKEIKGKFFKDYDTFGKMDPFVIFSVGSLEARTQTHSEGGKEPVWQSVISLKYSEEKTLLLKVYEEDLAANEYIGVGTVDLSAIKPKGFIDIPIIGENQQVAGNITCTYTNSIVRPPAFLLLKNMNVLFYRQVAYLSQTKPYLSLSSGQQTVESYPKQEELTRLLKWQDQIKIKMEEDDSMVFDLLNKNQEESRFFRFETNQTEFNTDGGHKRYNVNDNNYQPLGVLEFDYQTINFMEPQQLLRKTESGQSLMNRVHILKLKGQIDSDGKDSYIQFLLGKQNFKTDSFKTIGSISQQVDRVLLSEEEQSKLVISLWRSEQIENVMYGHGYLSFPMKSGENTVNITDLEGKSIGTIYLTTIAEKLPAKSIKFTDINLDINSNQSSIKTYLVGKVGEECGWTETGKSTSYTFHKELEFTVEQESSVKFQVWSQDPTHNCKIVEAACRIHELKQAQGELIIPLNSFQYSGSLTMKYETKNFNFQQPVPSPRKETRKFTMREDAKKKTQQIRDSEAQKLAKLESTETRKSHGKAGTISPIKNSRYYSKLPSLQFRNFGDKIFDKQSSSTLQKSIHVYSMPKGARFENGPKYQGEPSYFVDTCFKKNSGRGAGFGYGRKKQFPQWMERNMKENPAPGAYFDSFGNTTVSIASKGPSFGISHKYYEKVTIPKQKKMLLNTQKKCYSSIGFKVPRS